MTRTGLARSMATGLGVDLAAAVVLRGLSLATTVVVARWLSEADYGAVSLALAIYGVSDMLTNPALGIAIIRRPDLDARTVDVAWTLSLVRSALLSAGIYLSAPLLTRLWHGATDTASFLRVLSLAPLSGALANMHAIQLQRSLRFGKAMLLDNSRLVAASLTTLALLYVTRDAKALVTGIVVGNCVYAAISWVIISPRPRLALDRATLRELTEVSRWLMASGVLVYLCQTVDNLFVGRALGLAALGAYALAWRVVNTFMTLFTRAIAKMLVPAYRDLSVDRAALLGMVQQTLYVSSVVGAWAIAVVLLTAPDLFLVLAGKGNYLDAAAIARALTPFVFTRILNNVVAPLYQGVGEPRTLTVLSALQLVLLGPAMYLGATLSGVVGVALAVSLVTVAISATLLVLVHRRFEVSLVEELKATFLPLLAALPAIATGVLVSAAFSKPVPRLLVGAMVVTLLYVAAWEGLHRLLGVPPVVAPLANMVKAKWKRRRA